MSMPPNLKVKYLARFDELIAEGLRVLQILSGEREGKSFASNQAALLAGLPVSQSSEQYLVLQNKIKTLISNVLPPSHPNRKNLSFGIEPVHGCQSSIALLRATRDDLDRGFLESLSAQIEAKIGSDYLAQAGRLLKEGCSGEHEYVPAAVLAGAVLERSLRTLCDAQTPKILTVKGNGEPMTMNPLIDELKKAGVFNELRAKELRSWADVRNAAAHGEFQKFNREQVERMLAGITSFLAEML